MGRSRERVGQRKGLRKELGRRVWGESWGRHKGAETGRLRWGQGGIEFDKRSGTAMWHRDYLYCVWRLSG